MAQNSLLDTSITSRVKQYASVLEKNGVVIDKIILFGSRAKGNSKPWSDYDLCIVSKQFGKNRFLERVKLMKLIPRERIGIEPHPYHPADLQEKYDPLAAEIRKHGIVVK